MKTKLQTLIFILLFYSYAFGQERHGGTPLMFDSNGLRTAKTISIEKREFPIIDNESELRKADSIALSNGYEKNKFYGIGVPINLDFKQVATVETVGDSGKVYLLELSSPTAFALQVYFDAFKIPKGSRMFVYDSDKTMFLGSFTYENNFINNRFGTEFIRGNSLIIEYYEPNEVDFEAQIHIERLVHTFMDLRHGPFSWDNPYSSTGKGAAPCNINVNCSLGYGWDREKRAVAIILGAFWNPNTPTIYNGFCSGTLINNTAQDGRPFFLSANHCLGSPMESTLDWIFLFNHEAQNCSDNGSNVSSYLGQSVYGALKLASDGYDSYSPTSDYLLLDLNTSAATLKSYGVVYAGWEANESKAVNSSYTVGIHHPSGDVKKISMDAHPPVSANSPFSGALSTHWQVSWDMGITEGGSSGSPLFNSDHKIIGQLHGGSSSCQTPQAPDFYGKFSKSFTNGNLSYWLDPYFSGATSIGTYNPSQINENCYNGTRDGTETGTDCGGNCPPCGWTSPIGGGTISHCYNGVPDEGETGIDCGGTCKPCGGAAQCSNCKKDGDETGVDCGGSCPPCNNNCTDKMDVVYSNTNNLPSSTVAQNSITTNVNVNILPKQSVTFKAGSAIVLNNGFSASEGSTFSAFIAPCDCKQPCPVLYPNVFTPNGDGANDWLVYVVTGYNRFEVKVFKNGSNLIYSSSGTISGNYAYVWNGSGSASGNAYVVETTLYSDCLGVSKLISHMVNVLKSAGNNSEEYSEEIPTDINLNNMPEEIKIYPNPAKEFITIKYPYHTAPIIYIVNESGKVVYLKKDVNIDNGTLNINVSNFVSGVYIIKIVYEGELFVKKFIKN